MLWFVACASLPAPAAAQWYVAGYLGANATRPATVSIEVPASNVAIDFHDVEFAARPFESPQYYGWRVGGLFGARRRFGVEAEFIHLKVIGKTGAAYSTSGTAGTSSFVPGQPMRSLVERYSMTHGLNFLVVNVVARRELAEGRAAFVVRGGGGPTIPHTETTVLGQAVDQYEFAGLGWHAAAGLDVRLRGRWSLVGEYEFTYARPEITVSGGHGRTTAATHHVAVGLAFGLSR